MNILKHMEAVFLVTLGLASVASVAVDTRPQTHAKAPVAYAASSATPATMPVVVISAKRLTDAEKWQSLQEESKVASVRTAARSSI